MTHYVPYDCFDDLHDGRMNRPHTFLDLLLAVVRTLPRDFSLRDFYRRQSLLAQVYPDNREIEASIRAGLQTLRDAGLIQFRDNRGQYRRLPAAEPPRRAAA